MLDRCAGSGAKLGSMTDHEYRRPWLMALDEAAEALRQAAEQLACAPERVLVLPALRYQQPPWPPCQIAIERRILLQGHRVETACRSMEH